MYEMERIIENLWMYDKINLLDHYETNILYNSHIDSLQTVIENTGVLVRYIVNCATQYSNDIQYRDEAFDDLLYLKSKLYDRLVKTSHPRDDIDDTNEELSKVYYELLTPSQYSSVEQLQRYNNDILDMYVNLIGNYRVLKEERNKPYIDYNYLDFMDLSTLNSVSDRSYDTEIKKFVEFLFMYWLLDSFHIIPDDIRI